MTSVFLEEESWIAVEREGCVVGSGAWETRKTAQQSEPDVESRIVVGELNLSIFVFFLCAQCG